MNSNKYLIAIVAGEPSGDLLAADLINQLKQNIPNLEFVGVVGPKMIEAGCVPIANISDLSVMGFHQVLFKIISVLNVRKKLIKFFKETKPDLFIGVDFTDFNLSLAKRVKKLGIKTIQYKGPSIWAWRQYRLHKVKKFVDLVLTVFPFEQRFYEQHNVNAQYVGHMLFRNIPYEIDVHMYKEKLGLPKGKKNIAILPGSRTQEIKIMAPIFIQAAQKCYEVDHDLIFTVAHFNVEKRKQFDIIEKKIKNTLPFTHIVNRAHEVLAASDIVLVVSGTATLEAMLFKKPMVVSYVVPKIYYYFLRYLIKVPYVALPNLLANEELVPELLQHNATPDKLAKTLLAMLNNKQIQNDIVQKFHKIHKVLNNSKMKLQQIIREVLAI